jgi:hypothetical protein
MPVRNFDRPFRYGYYPEDTKDEETLKETKDIQTDTKDIQTDTKDTQTDTKDTQTDTKDTQTDTKDTQTDTIDTQTDTKESGQPNSKPKKSKKKDFYFSQISSKTRRIKMLLGEADLTRNTQFALSELLEKIGDNNINDQLKLDQNITDMDLENVDTLWADFVKSIKTTDRKGENERRIVKKYLDQVGFGYKLNKNGLNTSDIKKMSKKIDGVILPVIASDEILELKKSLSSKTKLYSFIMNLDPSDKPGSHWVAVIIDNIDKYVGYYDSLCIHPTKQILKDIKQLVKSVDPAHMFKFKFNTVKDQSNTSGKCGMYAMGFLHNIMNGMNFKKASGYMNHDYKEHSIDDMFKGFGYI